VFRGFGAHYTPSEVLRYKLDWEKRCGKADKDDIDSPADEVHETKLIEGGEHAFFGGLRLCARPSRPGADDDEWRGPAVAVSVWRVPPRALADAESAFDGGGALVWHRAIARGGRLRSRNSGPAESYEKPGCVARPTPLRAYSAPAGPPAPRADLARAADRARSHLCHLVRGRGARSHRVARKLRRAAHARGSAHAHVAQPARRRRR